MTVSVDYNVGLRTIETPDPCCPVSAAKHVELHFACLATFNTYPLSHRIKRSLLDKMEQCGIYLEYS